MNKKALAGVVVASCLGSACAVDDDPVKPFDATRRERQEVRVKWVVAKDVAKTCEAESRARGFRGFGFQLNACSFWQGNDCTIVTSERPTMHTLGHELRHCFAGNWH